jgi:hypothetical protein
MRHETPDFPAAATPGTAGAFAKIVAADVDAMRSLARTRNIPAE